MSEENAPEVVNEEDTAMTKWRIMFWNRHGERFIFTFVAVCFSVVLYLLEMKAEAKTIFVGLGMLYFNKVRGNGATIDKTPK